MDIPLAKKEQKMSDFGELDEIDIPDVDIQYQPSSDDDECEGGACKI